MNSKKIDLVATTTNPTITVVDFNNYIYGVSLQASSTTPLKINGIDFFLDPASGAATVGIEDTLKHSQNSPNLTGVPQLLGPALDTYLYVMPPSAPEAMAFTFVKLDGATSAPSVQLDLYTIEDGTATVSDSTTVGVGFSALQPVMFNMTATTFGVFGMRGRGWALVRVAFGF